MNSYSLLIMELVGVCSGGITSLLGASGVMVVVPMLNLAFGNIALVQLGG